MVAAVSPVRPLVNVPVPAPLVVLKFEVVGFDDVLQQTPRAVTAAPLSDATFPPVLAVVGVILITEDVVNAGK
jgi:hypothetical protein